ncbi:ABC-three component system middle component 8 [Celeribacter halophilus]
MQYDALRKFASKAAIGGDVLFLPAVHLLFLLGLTEYRAKTDAFEYSPKK